MNRITPALVWLLFMMGMALADYQIMGDKRDLREMISFPSGSVPTTTAILLYWFGEHGYPKLIPKGDDENERMQQLKADLMQVAGGDLQKGTPLKPFTKALEKYVADKGYFARVSVVDFVHAPKDQTWSLLKQNDRPDVGYILMVTGGLYNEQGRFVVNPNLGHAVNFEKMAETKLLIYDPCHATTDSGEQEMSVQSLTTGTSFDPETGKINPAGGCYVLSKDWALGGNEYLLSSAIQIVMSKTPIPEAVDPYMQVSMIDDGKNALPPRSAAVVKAVGPAPLPPPGVVE